MGAASSIFRTGVLCSRQCGRQVTALNFIPSDALAVNLFKRLTGPHPVYVGVSAVNSRKVV